MQRLIATLALSALAITGCGSGGSEPSATEPNDDSPGTTATSSAGTDYTERICAAIKEVQADLLPNAVSAAYLAQLAVKLSNFLPPAGTAEDTIDEPAVERLCPVEYEAILRQADIQSLRTL